MPSRPQLSRILLLLSGNGLAQLIAIAAVPVLAHLYSPADFGNSNELSKAIAAKKQQDAG